MNKQQMLDSLTVKALELIENENSYSRDKEDAIWNKCSDWNSENPDQEIFMCEKYSDVKPNTCIGFYIEDDYFIFPEYKDAFEGGEI